MTGERGAAELRRLALEILSVGRTRLMLRLRFLARGLWRLTPQPSGAIATDGERLFYAPEAVVRLYREDPDNALRVWLHPLLHCVFRHMFVHASLDRRLWDLASDIAVENAILELEPENGAHVRQRKALASLRLMEGPTTAEWLYRGLRARRRQEGELAELERIFRLDDHALWYGGEGEPTRRVEGDDATSDAGVPGGESSPRDEGRATKDLYPLAGTSNAPCPTPTRSLEGAQAVALEAWWRHAAETMLEEMEPRSGGRSEGPGRFEQVFQGLDVERRDYRAFLRRFAALHETPEPSQEEFDLICYTWGLSLYRDMPLLEPMEYREDRRIRELAVVIDTSGSVRGDLARAFLQRTFSILTQEDTFGRRFRVHILQCDAAVQQDTLIASRQDLDAFMRRGVLSGFGGTDFRPAFEHVERLRRQGGFQRLQGLLYLTDGKGTFPKRPPDYPVAFIFLDYGHARLAGVPPWAMRVVLSREDVIELYGQAG